MKSRPSPDDGTTGLNRSSLDALPPVQSPPCDHVLFPLPLDARRPPGLWLVGVETHPEREDRISLVNMRTGDVLRYVAIPDDPPEDRRGGILGAVARFLSDDNHCHARVLTAIVGLVLGAIISGFMRKWGW